VQVLLIAPPLLSLVSSSFHSVLALLRRLNLHTAKNLILWCARSFWWYRHLSLSCLRQFCLCPLYFCLVLFIFHLLLFARDSPFSRDVIAAADQRFQKIPSRSSFFFYFSFCYSQIFFSFLSLIILRTRGLQLSLSVLLLLLSFDYWWLFSRHGLK